MKTNLEKDILNVCGHRNSERVKASKELPSGICPACLLDRIKGTEAENKRLREELERVQGAVGEEDYKSIEQVLKA